MLIEGWARAGLGWDWTRTGLKKFHRLINGVLNLEGWAGAPLAPPPSALDSGIARNSWEQCLHSPKRQI